MFEIRVLLQGIHMFKRKEKPVITAPIPAWAEAITAPRTQFNLERALAPTAPTVVIGNVYRDRRLASFMSNFIADNQDYLTGDCLSIRGGNPSLELGLLQVATSEIFLKSPDLSGVSATFVGDGTTRENWMTLLKTNNCELSPENGVDIQSFVIGSLNQSLVLLDRSLRLPYPQ